jgi:hypothetical protein
MEECEGVVEREREREREKEDKTRAQSLEFPGRVVYY